MAKFIIIAALQSEMKSGKNFNDCESKIQLVFSSETMEHPVKHGNVITFDCDGFLVDDENSSSNWQEAFDFKEEPPRRVIITVKTDYKSGVALSYVD